MIAKYNRMSFFFGIPGLLLQIACVFLSNVFTTQASAGTVPSVFLMAAFGFFEIVGGVLLIVGLCFYAKAKGYSAALGMLGLLSCLGLLIIALLPDKTKDRNSGTG